MTKPKSTKSSQAKIPRNLDAFDNISKSTLRSLNNLNNEVTGEMSSISVEQSLTLLKDIHDVKLFLKTKNASAHIVCVQRVLNDLLFDRSQGRPKLSERLKQDGKWGPKTADAIGAFQKVCNQILKTLGVDYQMKQDKLIGSEVINAMLSFESGRPLEFLMLKLGMSQDKIDELFKTHMEPFFRVFSNLGQVIRGGLPTNFFSSDSIGSSGVEERVSDSIQESDSGHKSAPDRESVESQATVASAATKQSTITSVPQSPVSAADETEKVQESLPAALKQKVRVILKEGGVAEPEVMTVAVLLTRVKGLDDSKQVEVNGRVYTVSQIKRLQDSKPLGESKGLWSRIAFDYGLEFEQEFEDTDKDQRYKFQKMVERYPRLVPYYEYLRRIIQEESQWRPKLKSGSGKAYGLAQIKRSYYQYYLHNIKRLDQGKQKDALGNMNRLLNPSYNLRVFLSVINRQAQWMLDLDYVKRYPDRIGFVLYIIHHDGFKGSRWTLKYLQEAESVNAKTFAAFMRKHRARLPKSWHANFGVLKAVLNKAAIVNGRDLDGMFAPESVTNEYMQSKVQFFGDSLAAGVQGCLYPRSRPEINTTQPGWTSSRLQDCCRDLSSCADREYGVIFMGHNDMLMKSGATYQSREDKVVENMRSVIASMRAIGMKPIIILPQEFAKVEKTRYGSIDPKIIAKLVAKLEFEFGSELMIKTAKSSKLHLSARGYQAVLQQVRATIYDDRVESLQV